MSELDHILRALNHPLRRQILRAMVDEARSASSLSKEFRVGLGVVSYHLNTVLARECDIIDLVDSVQRRGALEKFYRVKGNLRRSSSLGSTQKKKKATTMSLEESVLALVLGIVEVSEIRTSPSSS
jgi:DNA-binding transcriptional ArsR family regulator